MSYTQIARVRVWRGQLDGEKNLLQRKMWNGGLTEGEKAAINSRLKEINTSIEAFDKGGEPDPE